MSKDWDPLQSGIRHSSQSKMKESLRDSCVTTKIVSKGLLIVNSPQL